MTVQELIDWLERAIDPDGAEGIDPNAEVQIVVASRKILTPRGAVWGPAHLRMETMTGDTLSFPLETAYEDSDG